MSRITPHKNVETLPTIKILSNLRRHIWRSLCFSLLVCLCVAVSASMACAQQEESASLNAPPPMKIIALEDRSQLSGARDAKARTRLSLELADAHLSRAEELSGQRNYDAADTELGAYQGIIEDAFIYLQRTGRDDSKIRDLYRKIELNLRAHGSRIESIRRVTPYEHAVNIKAVADFTRRQRTAALNTFYGDTVMREDRQSTPPSADEHHKSSPAPENTAP